LWVEPISGITGKYLFFLHNIIQKNEIATFFYIIKYRIVELTLYKKNGTFSKSSSKWHEIREL